MNSIPSLPQAVCRTSIPFMTHTSIGSQRKIHTHISIDSRLEWIHNYYHDRSWSFCGFQSVVHHLCMTENETRKSIQSAVEREWNGIRSSCVTKARNDTRRIFVSSWVLHSSKGNAGDNFFRRFSLILVSLSQFFHLWQEINYSVVYFLCLVARVMLEVSDEMMYSLFFLLVSQGKKALRQEKRGIWWGREDQDDEGTFRLCSLQYYPHEKTTGNCSLLNFSFIIPDDKKRKRI